MKAIDIPCPNQSASSGPAGGFRETPQSTRARDTSTHASPSKPWGYSLSISTWANLQPSPSHGIVRVAEIERSLAETAGCSDQLSPAPGLKPSSISIALHCRLPEGGSSATEPSVAALHLIGGGRPAFPCRTDGFRDEAAKSVSIRLEGREVGRTSSSVVSVGCHLK